MKASPLTRNVRNGPRGTSLRSASALPSGKRRSGCAGPAAGEKEVLSARMAGKSPATSQMQREQLVGRGERHRQMLNQPVIKKKKFAVNM